VKDVFRGRHPQRVALKKQLREIARRDPRFALETTLHGAVCLLAADAGRAAVAPVETTALPQDPGDALEALLRAAGGPLLLNDVLAALYNAAEGLPRRDADADTDTPLRRLERREDLASLWKEILLLPARQRLALLLNLRGDGGGSAIALLVLVGVTTFDGLAEALAMTPEELGAIWSELPLGDLEIAAKLGVTRQQVINLRKAARKRLGHRRAE
jgi:hypothetical protein